MAACCWVRGVAETIPLEVCRPKPTATPFFADEAGLEPILVLWAALRGRGVLGLPLSVRARLWIPRKPSVFIGTVMVGVGVDAATANASRLLPCCPWCW